MVVVMNEFIDEAVRRLMACGYDVVSDDHGFLVRNRTDSTDISRACHLKDLSDLADLWEWANQRQAVQYQRAASSVPLPSRS